VGKPEGKSPLGGSRHGWEDNIKMDLREVGWGAWTGLIWHRTVVRWQAVMKAMMDFQVP